jgi:hypothetical protein
MPQPAALARITRQKRPERGTKRFACNAARCRTGIVTFSKAPPLCFGRKRLRDQPPQSRAWEEVCKLQRDFSKFLLNGTAHAADG